MNHRGSPSLARFVLCFIFSVPSALAQNNSPQDKPVASSAEQLKKFEDAIAPYVKSVALALLPAVVCRSWLTLLFVRRENPLTTAPDLRCELKAELSPC